MKTFSVLLLSLVLSHAFSQNFEGCNLNSSFNKQLIKKGIITCPAIGFNPNSGNFVELNGSAKSDTSYILTNIDVSRSPQQVMIPPGSHKAFVFCMGTAEILVIDLVSATIENTIDLTAFAVDMTMNSSGSKIYISCASSQPPINYPPDDCGSVGIAIGPSPIIVINTQTQTIDTSIINNVSFKKVILNEMEGIMYTIGAQDYINSYDLNTYGLLDTYNLSALSGNTSQPRSAALAADAHKLFLKSVVFIGPDVIEQIQVIDLVTNSFHTIEFDTLGYSSSTFLPLMMSPDGQDIYVDVSGSNPPYTPGTFIFDAETEILKKIVFNLSTEGNYIPLSDSTAYFDDDWLFGNKTLFDHKNYAIIKDMTIGGCSGVLSPDKETLYLTQIGANHDEGVTYGSPEKYDISIVNVATEEYDVIYVSDETFTCTYERMMAMTTDGSYIITTNSALNTVSILKIVSSVAIKENTENNEIRIYPNPNSGVFSIEMNNKHKDIINIQVFDVMNRIIYQQREIIPEGRIEKQIDLNNNPSGLYNLIVTGSNNTFVRRIIKR
jgi:hypothetical protein